MRPNEERPFDLMEFYNEMVEQESDEFTFLVKRNTPEPGKSLSSEAMEMLTTVFTGFVSSRLSASLHRRGPDGSGHREVQVSLKVTIDGESVSVDDDLHPWYGLVDGEHRSGPH